MAKKKCLVVLGTRPEAIKMAPVIKELSSHSDFDCRVCVTGQHRQMVEPLLKLFHIQPDFDLDIMKENQTLVHITQEVIRKMDSLIDRELPDYLLVQGDTTTAMGAALGAFYKKTKVGHIEAGLRTWNKLHPYPEEVNRRIIDSLSDLYFAHTESAKRNLLKEGVADESIEVTGNTVIDALLDVANREFDPQTCPELKDLNLNGERMILVTAHRRESFGKPFESICCALKKIASAFPDSRVVYPVHLNPNVQKAAYSFLRNIDNISLTPPLDYLPFVYLLKNSYMVLTDSGGVQEEAPSLGKPVLVMRETTERPEAVNAGTVEIVGTREVDIVNAVSELMENKKKYDRMSKAINPYGDGKAASRISKRLLNG